MLIIYLIYILGYMYCKIYLIYLHHIYFNTLLYGKEQEFPGKWRFSDGDL